MNDDETTMTDDEGRERRKWYLVIGFALQAFVLGTLVGGELHRHDFRDEARQCVDDFAASNTKWKSALDRANAATEECVQGFQRCSSTLDRCMAIVQGAR